MCVCECVFIYTHTLTSFTCNLQKGTKLLYEQGFNLITGKGMLKKIHCFPLTQKILLYNYPFWPKIILKRDYSLFKNKTGIIIVGLIIYTEEPRMVIYYTDILKFLLLENFIKNLRLDSRKPLDSMKPSYKLFIRFHLQCL